MANNSNNSYIKFWGVRGSIPTPDKDKMHYGGDTSCIEIRTKKNSLIILDMGTGLRNLGSHIMTDNTYGNEINIFLSHYHWDHIMGFFYFAPLYDSRFTINIHGYNAKNEHPYNLKLDLYDRNDKITSYKCKALPLMKIHLFLPKDYFFHLIHKKIYLFHLLYKLYL